MLVEIVLSTKCFALTLAPGMSTVPGRRCSVSVDRSLVSKKILLGSKFHVTFAAVKEPRVSDLMFPERYIRNHNRLGFRISESLAHSLKIAFGSEGLPVATSLA